MKRPFINISGALALLVCLTVVTGLRADDFAPKSFQDSTDLTLDQLVNIQVTSVGKKETKLNDSPAAISVLTQDDIRESGLKTLPELLRLVPGVEVSQNSMHDWSVGIRGFGDGLVNKVQVLIDGRTAYSSTVGGVHWDVQDVVLEDVDRVEVIRGPGATLWGANAMNGVINVITKSAKDTQGGLVSLTYGTDDQPSTLVRYGGQLATNLYYRVYVKYFNRTSSENADGSDFGDAWTAGRTGFRLDWEPSPENLVTLQGDGYYGRFHEIDTDLAFVPPYAVTDPDVVIASGLNVLGRWTHSFSETSQTTLQLYYDYASENNGGEVEAHHIYDFDLQHHFDLGSRQDLVAGIGYRFTRDELDSTPELTINAPVQDEQLYNVFLQDSVAVVPDRLTLTLGAKAEHNSFTGFEFQPSGRLLWQATDHQVVWGAVSRAVRTPSVLERNGRLNTEVTPPSTVNAQFGNPNLKSEELLAYELGYRIEPVKQLSFDVAAFYNVYDKLVMYVPGEDFPENLPAPAHTVAPSTAENKGSGHSYGAELSARWQVTADWRLTGGYSWLQSDFPAGLNDDTPGHEVFIRSHLSICPQLELDGTASYYSHVASDNAAAYLRCDAGVTWHPFKSIDVSVVGQDLLSPRHIEFDSEAQSQIPRSFYGKVTWRF